jgi:hypothetical protein
VHSQAELRAPTKEECPMEDSTSKSPEHRAAVVVGIRALADFIENRTDLPVPTSVDCQHSNLEVDKTEELVHATAPALDVEPNIYADRSNGMSVTHLIGDKYGRGPYEVGIRYTVHGFLPAVDAEAGEQA